MFAALTLLSMLAISARGSEPQCSPYHFVEQTLTKVIQVEMVVMKMKEDLAATQQKVLDKLQELEADKNQINSDLDTKVEKMKKEHDDLISDNKAQMDGFTSQFEKMKDHWQPVLFLAKEVTNLSPSGGETLVFKTTMINNGSGYDSSSGTFTAPVSGVYMFTLQLCISRGTQPLYAIMADGRIIKHGFFYDRDDNSCHTADAVTILNQGGNALITVTNGGKLIQSSNYWNTFSGVLIHRIV